MGKKYTLKRSIVKKRPKTRGPYEEKPYDPSKPRTNAEKDKVWPGYSQFSRLQRGILETGEDEENEADEIDGIPTKWAQLMTDDPETQEQFLAKLSEAEKNYKAAASSTDNDDIVSDMSDRLEAIQRRHPSFIEDLINLVEPLSGYQIDETSAQVLSNLPPEHVATYARRKFGLMTLDRLLNIIDAINRAEKGKLRTPPKIKK